MIKMGEFLNKWIKLIPFISLIVLSCGNYDYPTNDASLKRIYKKAEDGSILKLSDYTNFNWNNVAIFNTGTDAKTYRLFLKDKPMLIDPKLREVLIFRNNNDIIKIIARDWNPEKYSSIQFSLSRGSGTYQIFSKDQAVFKVEKVLYDTETFFGNKKANYYIKLHPVVQNII